MIDKRIAVALCAWLTFAGSAVAAAPPVVTTPGSTWIAKEALTRPVLPELVMGSAGCVVVGLHVMPDGEIRTPRVLQGAFLATVDDAQQKAFSSAVLDAAKDWHFRPSDPQQTFQQSFHRVTMGFMPDQDGSVVVRVGEDSQDARLGEACAIKDLAAWGKVNAIPVEEALARNADRIYVKNPGDALYFWVLEGAMQPPRFPREAAIAGVEACVLVGVGVGVDGRVTSTRMLDAKFKRGTPKSLAKAVVDAALEAAGAWHFAPGPDNLGRMPALLQFPVDFWVEDTGAAKGKCALIDLAERLRTQTAATDAGSIRP